MHICIHASWCGGNDGALFILALVGPPNGRLLARLCDLLDGMAKNELLVSDSLALLLSIHLQLQSC